MRTVAFWLAIVVGLGSLAIADAPVKGPLVLDRETKLLGWRLVADLPTEMTGDNDPSRGWEASRFELVRNLVHFTMVVADSFGTVGEGELSRIKAHAAFNDPALANAKIEKLQLANWTAYSLEPRAIENRAGRSLIYVAYVIVPNGTVKVFKFYVDPGADQSYAWVSLAKKIVQTVRGGRNADRIAASNRQVCHGECSMLITTPDGWAVTRRDGKPDRWVLREVVVLGAPLGSCDIAFNGHAAGPAVDLHAATSPPVRLWDRTEWKVVVSKGRLEALAQTKRSPYMPVSLYCVAPDKNALDRILEVMATLRPGEL